MAQWLTNPTRNHEVEGSVPALARWVNDRCCRELWCRSQTRLGSCIAVTLAGSADCSEKSLQEQELSCIRFRYHDFHRYDFCRRNLRRRKHISGMPYPFQGPEPLFEEPASGQYAEDSQEYRFFPDFEYRSRCHFRHNV